MDSNMDNIKKSIENLKTKNSRIYFLTQDVKGTAKASVAYIYDMALSLVDDGFNAIILHEKNDYEGVDSWLGGDYMNRIPHKSIEGQNLEISPEDFIVIPEIYGFIMEQLKNLPCGKIVLTQMPTYMLETLQPGQTWSQFGFHKCITTSERGKEYIGSIMKNSSIDVIEPYISIGFRKHNKPPKTVITIHSREHSDTVNIIKSFYLKYPQYRWFTFRDMVGMSRGDFSDAFNESFLSVWVDDDSGFGTFPLESMVSGVPVIAKIPDLVPDWMTEHNGIYLKEKNLIIDQIAIFIQNWLEDNINNELYENMEETVSKFTDYSVFDSKVVELFSGYLNSRMKAFEEQIYKTEKNEE